MPVRGDVLVFPRLVVSNLGPFTPAADLGSFDRFVGGFEWMPRRLAEQSSTYVQALPSACLCDSQGNYLVLQRIKSARRSLRSRLTLVVGGHVEPLNSPDPAWADSTSLDDLLLATLVRELREELGVRLAGVVLEPLGVVVDPRGMDASRHVAFLYRACLDSGGDVSVRALEEFAAESPFSAQWWPSKALRRLLPSLDPWSEILVRSGVLDSFG